MSKSVEKGKKERKILKIKMKKSKKNYKILLTLEL